MLSPSVRSLRLALADGPLSFAAGQWVDLYVDTASGMQKRAYSIASGPQEATLELAVTLVSEGAASPSLHALREGDALQVNSRHHQGVQRLAPGFDVTATAPDGVIEAMERTTGRFCVGVQWHPENFWRTGEFRPLFDGFVAACGK